MVPKAPTWNRLRQKRDRQRGALCSLRFLNKRADIAIGEGERLFLDGIRALGAVTARIDGWNVVRHQHSVITHIAISPHRGAKIDVSIIGEAFGDEVVPVTFDIAKVNVENLFPLAEISDDGG